MQSLPNGCGSLISKVLYNRCCFFYQRPPAHGETGLEDNTTQKKLGRRRRGYHAQQGLNRENMFQVCHSRNAGISRATRCCSRRIRVVPGVEARPVQSRHTTHDSSIGSSLFNTAAGRCDFTCAHQIANVLLEELVVAVELVVLFANGFDSVEDSKERFLECLGVPIHRLALETQGCKPL